MIKRKVIDALFNTFFLIHSMIGQNAFKSHYFKNELNRI